MIQVEIVQAFPYIWFVANNFLACCNSYCMNLGSLGRERDSSMQVHANKVGSLPVHLRWRTGKLFSHDVGNGRWTKIGLGIWDLC
jgi:hypothetical protein